MRRRRSFTLFVFGALATGFAVANGCSAGNNGSTTGFTDGDGGASTHNPTNAGGHDGPSSSVGMLTTSTGLASSTGTGDSGPDAPMNPCGTACGPTELCDEEHLGRDDNCDGRVDEGCTCVPGQAHSCFKGDYSYINNAGCFPGTEKCTELGVWGPCTGGVHADNVDKCYENNTTACHAITSQPFSQVSLKDGTGTFSGNADSGSEKWTVACPTGVSPCPTPGPTPADAYTPLQSGEYSVTYTKTVGGTPATCTYPLIVGARGLRVELSWEFVKAGSPASTVDLDLHLHKPLDYNPWNTSGSQEDCGYGNCKIDSVGENFPQWFTGLMPPDPVNWYLDPDHNQNGCFFAPRGAGAKWEANGKGCHNPRLDTDNITCNPALTDPKDTAFCAPENINVDYPPADQWFRIGVHFFYAHDNPSDIHPLVKVYCGGSLAAELGHTKNAMSGALDPEGYSDVVTFPGGSGDGFGTGNAFWLVGDVIFKPGDGMCAPSTCIFQPLYAAGTQAPLITTDNEVEADFVPDYPNIPTGTGGAGGN